MTPEEKIAALVQRIENDIENEFPNGCKDIRCSECPLNEAKYATIAAAMCDILVRTKSEQSP